MDNITGLSVDTYGAMGKELRKFFIKIAKRKAVRTNMHWSVELNNMRANFLAVLQQYNARMIIQALG